MERMKMKPIVATMVAVVLTWPAMAEPAFDLYPGSGVSSAHTKGEWESPILTIFDDADCDLPVECSIFTLECDDGLKIAVEGIDEPKLAKWLGVRDDMKIEVSGLGMEGKAPQASEILRSSLDGSWAAVFRVYYTSDPGLTIEGDQFVIKAMPRTVTIPLTTDNRATLQQFVEICAHE
jgi:hypothetical protein